jgi:regulator of replication initiation timing
MWDWSGVAADGGWDVDGLIAENAELADRLRLLGPALSSMAQDLAHARRENGALRSENGALRRENLRLRMLLGEHAEDSHGA